MYGECDCILNFWISVSNHRRNGIFWRWNWNCPSSSAAVENGLVPARTSRSIHSSLSQATRLTGILRVSNVLHGSQSAVTRCRCGSGNLTAVNRCRIKWFSLIVINNRQSWLFSRSLVWLKLMLLLLCSSTHRLSGRKTVWINNVNHRSFVHTQRLEIPNLPQISSWLHCKSLGSVQ